MTDTRLGSLLVRMGLISDSTLQEALKQSMAARLPLGQALILQEALTASVLRLAVEAQWMIKDGALTERNAIRAMQLARRNGWQFSDALIALGVEANPERGARLGELLIGANLLEPKALSEQLALACRTGLPLGRVLTLTGRIGEGCITHTIRLQESVRQELLTVEQAIEILLKIGENLNFGNFKLGELLVAARKLTAAELKTALEMSASLDKPIEDLLLELGWVAQADMDRASTLQQRMRINVIDYERAVELMKDVGVNLDEASRTPRKLSLTFYGLLRLSGYFDENKLESAVEKLMDNPKVAFDALKYTHTDAPSNVKEAIKLVFDDSVACARALELVFPQDREELEQTEIAHRDIGLGKVTIEEALIRIHQHQAA